MGKIRISKCGSRFTEKPYEKIKEAKEKKPIQKKRTYRKVSEKIGNDFPASIEDENLDGVSV